MKLLGEFIGFLVLGMIVGFGLLAAGLSLWELFHPTTESLPDYLPEEPDEDSLGGRER